jgi:hypothetical protein
MAIAKKRLIKDEKKEDEEYDEEDLREEELQTLFITTYVESKMKFHVFH